MLFYVTLTLVTGGGQEGKSWQGTFLPLLKQLFPEKSILNFVRVLLVAMMREWCGVSLHASLIGCNLMLLIDREVRVREWQNISSGALK